MAASAVTSKPPAPVKKPPTPTRTPSRSSTPSPATRKPDTSSVSADAKAKESGKTDLADSFKDTYKDDGYQTDKVSTDEWRKGPNDTIEGMLKGKGFSLKDIYSKDKNGQSLVDKVMKANGIKDPRKIADGKELLIPHRGDDAAGVATSGKKPGETEKATVGEGDKKVKIEAGKTKDGTNTTKVSDKRIKAEGESPGDSTVTASKDPKTGDVKTETLQKDKSGQVVTQTNTTTGDDKSTADIKARKGKLDGKADSGSVEVENRGTKQKLKFGDGDDSKAEKFGAKVDGWLHRNTFGVLGKETEGPSKPVDIKRRQESWGGQ